MPLLSTTFDNRAIAALESEATQADWMGDHFGRLGVDQEACRGRGAAAAGHDTSGAVAKRPAQKATLDSVE